MRFLFLPMILSLVSCQTTTEAKHEDAYAVGDCFLLSVQGESATGTVVDKGEKYYLVQLDVPAPAPVILHVEKDFFEKSPEVTAQECSAKD
jgi:hypothetical protein